MTPGAYLKCRRCAAGKSVADVAESIGTDPTVPAHLRAEWLKLIEADAAPIGWPTIVALRTCIPIDLLVLERLTMIQLGADVSMPRLCRLCGAVESGPLGMDVPKWGWAAAALCIGCAHATTEPAPV